MSPEWVGREESGSHTKGQAPPLKSRLFNLCLCPLFSLFGRTSFVGKESSHSEEGRGAEGEEVSVGIWSAHCDWPHCSLQGLTVLFRQRGTGRVGGGQESRGRGEQFRYSLFSLCLSSLSSSGRKGQEGLS